MVPWRVELTSFFESGVIFEKPWFRLKDIA
jgi:hypothetical protein